MLMRPYATYFKLPIFNHDIIICDDGTISLNGEQEISLNDFNSLNNTSITDVCVLIALAHHYFFWPPKYWEKLIALKQSNVIDIKPENIILGISEPVESLEFPGFYLIPYFSNYVISKEGILIKKSNCLEIKASKTALGYYTYRMTDDSGKTQNQLRHRILCYAFKPYPFGVEDLDVNHIDGVPGNDFLHNLEWATRSENMNHAYSLGLRNDNVEIQALDTNINRLFLFVSYSQAARFFNTSISTITNRVKTNGTKPFNGVLFRKFPCEDPWPVFESSGNFLVEFPDGTSKKCSCEEAAKLAGVTRTSLLRILRNGRCYGTTKNKITRLTE